MAGGVKSWLSRSAGQAAAVFILLSATGECLQCYWCGPRAEQVHRSQRAPSCNEVSNQVTTCDQGYTHCAVVATSPPFAESRHCIKFYQDECYAQYCNSTKSYRMTCPCRGDLCNGPNTERENEAFAALADIVANARIKRNAVTSSSFINDGKAKMNNLIENDDKEKNDDVSDTTNEDKVNIMQTEPPTAGLLESSNNITVASDTDVNIAPETPTEMVKTVESTTKVIEEMPMPMEVLSTAESLKIDLTTANTPEISMKPAENIKVDVNQFVSNEIKPNIQLPTAEALQQNASPSVTTEKNAEQTTGSTTIMTTESDIGTPMPTKSKNSSTVANLSTFIFISSLGFIISS